MSIARNNETTSEEKQVDRLLSNLDSIGWKHGLSRDWYAEIVDCGFRGQNNLLASIATELAFDHQPLTLRGLYYQIVSTGFLPSTDKQHYTRTGRVLSTLRQRGVIPYSWIVDIPSGEWERLQEVERIDNESWQLLIGAIQ